MQAFGLGLDAQELVHVSAKCVIEEDVDVGVNRSIDDMDNWKLRDPISRLCNSMIEGNLWSEEESINLEKEIDLRIDDAWDKALKDNYPDKNSTLEYVYSNKG